MKKNFSRKVAKTQSATAFLEDFFRLFAFAREIFLRMNISAIIATVGRPELLRLGLESLSKQTVPVSEAVASCGDDRETNAVTNDACWAQAGLDVRYFTIRRGLRATAQFRHRACEVRKPLLVMTTLKLIRIGSKNSLNPSGRSTSRRNDGKPGQPADGYATLFWRIYRTLLHVESMVAQAAGWSCASQRLLLLRKRRFLASGSVAAECAATLRHSSQGWLCILLFG